MSRLHCGKVNEMRYLICVFLLALSPIVAYAQDEVVLTELYNDETIMFKYPAGWFVVKNEGGSVELSNTEIQDDGGPLNARPGVVTIRLSNMAFVSSESLIIKEDDPVFMTGLNAGVLVGIDIIIMAFSGEESVYTVEELEEVEISGARAWVTSLRIEATSRGIELTFIASEDGWFALSEVAAGEMEQWTDTLFAILETVELPPDPT